MPGGEPLGAGGVLRQPALARTLRAIAAGGAAELYRGSVGERLVGGLGALGAPLRRSDLEAHSTELTVPLRRPFADLDIATAPPNSQGFVLLELLGALAAAGDVPDPLGEHLDLLARLCRLAARDRDRYLADPRWCDVPAELLVDPRYTAALLAMARNGASEPPALPVAGAGGGDPAAGPGGGDPAAGDTVAVVALDDEGYAVSLIQSVFWSFGAGVLEPATGILLHNRGAGFSLDPAAAGVLRGGARPPHTLMPVLALRGDDVAGAHGTRGGQAQPQIHLQVLLRLLRGASATEAVAAPRWIVGEDDRVRIERDADEAGHAQVVRRTATGELEAGTDPRAGGAGIVVER
jgi:gamma-glutamyltranspeptidase/glutathione hydrolase